MIKAIRIDRDYLLTAGQIIIWIDMMHKSGCQLEIGKIDIFIDSVELGAFVWR